MKNQSAADSLASLIWGFLLITALIPIGKFVLILLCVASDLLK